MPTPTIIYNNTGINLAGSIVAITPDDNNDVPGSLCNGLYVGGAGDVALKDTHGNQAVFKAVPVGAVIPVRIQRVLATGTTATNLVALY